jgi:hypothetical protein
MRAPVSRLRSVSGGRAGLLVCDHSLVGNLGLAGEFESAPRIISLVAHTPAARGVFLGAPAVISSRRSFLRVSEGCWWA